MKIKNIFMSLGTLGTILIPIATTISCANPLNNSPKEDIETKDKDPKVQKIVNGEQDWLDYVQRQSWNPSFKEEAIKGIEWVKDPRGIVKDNSFKDMQLPEEFILPNSIVSIGIGAFEGSTLLEGFTIPNGVKTIGDKSFFNATLPKGFAISKSVENIGQQAFAISQLPEGFVIPLTVKKIETNTFANVKLPEKCFWFDKDKNIKSKTDIPQAGWYIGKE